MRILVIGQSVKDIIHANEKESVSPGGIYYSVTGCLSCITDGDEIHLLTGVDAENKQLFSNVYELIVQDLISVEDKIPVVHLRIFETAERCEYYENITRKLSLDKITDYNKFDGIIINMITGFDITYDDLMNIRAQYKGPIYFDVHTLSRGIDENNTRVFRVIPDAEKWISALDFVQVNEHELYTLSHSADQLQIIKETLSRGVKYLLLTLGDRGVRAFWLKNGELCSLYYPAIRIETKNKVGCGDIFGSVFFCNFIKTGDLNLSLKKANAAGGCAAGYSGINEFHNLRYDTLTRSD